MSTVPMDDLPSEALDYPFDRALIATEPVRPRDSAKMLVLHRGEDRVEHRSVRDLPGYLPAGSTIVLNETRVAPLRFIGRRGSDGRVTEGLFIAPRQDGWWEILIKGARRFRAGDRMELLCAHGEAPVGEVIEVRPAQGSGWEGRIISDLGEGEAFDRSGRTPLPPYILEARRVRGVAATPDDRDRVDYQTVFARGVVEGGSLPSCAAPTAGLHFTSELLAAIAARGVARASIELQVGPGTFRPIEARMLSGHSMHVESCRLRAKDVLLLEGSNPDVSLVVGTTSVRCLESLPWPLPGDLVEAARGAAEAGDPERVIREFTTDLLVAPGFEFGYTRRLLTNFHLPRSTLLALVGALVGLERLKSLYAEAQRCGYRFYSLGDAMLILP